MSTQSNPSNISNLPSAIERAAAALARAKADESAAQKARLQAEAALLAAIVDPLPTEGTTRVAAGAYKVTVRTSVSRSIDQEKLQELAKQIPEAVGKRLFRWKPELEMRELRYLQDNEPGMYSVLAEAITAKPAKPSVSVELVEG